MSCYGIILILYLCSGGVVGQVVTYWIRIVAWVVDLGSIHGFESIKYNKKPSYSHRSVIIAGDVLRMSPPVEKTALKILMLTFFLSVFWYTNFRIHPIWYL
jgi:hypothetical protein